MREVRTRRNGGGEILFTCVEVSKTSILVGRRGWRVKVKGGGRGFIKFESVHVCEEGSEILCHENSVYVDL